VPVGGPNMAHKRMQKITQQMKAVQKFIQQIPVDYDYLKTLGMQMVKGRYFSPEFSDCKPYIKVKLQ